MPLPLMANLLDVFRWVTDETASMEQLFCKAQTLNSDIIWSYTVLHNISTEYRHTCWPSALLGPVVRVSHYPCYCSCCSAPLSLALVVCGWIGLRANADGLYAWAWPACQDGCALYRPISAVLRGSSLYVNLRSVKLRIKTVLLLLLLLLSP